MLKMSRTYTYEEKMNRVEEVMFQVKNVYQRTELLNKSNIYKLFFPKIHFKMQNCL